jgi:hypothetical protein
MYRRCWSAAGGYSNHLEIGGVVAFISGIGRLNDPWGDLVNYFRDLNVTQVKYRLLADAVDQLAPASPARTVVKPGDRTEA